MEVKEKGLHEGERSQKPEVKYENRKEDLRRKLTQVESNLLVNENEDVKEKLRRQMEFYFGDANLSKDKFLRDLISSHKKGYVDLTIFLNFKKIKSFLMNLREKNEQINTLSCAIEASSILSLNKGKTKVKRRIPFDIMEVNSEDINDCTVYVENFPIAVEHEDLAKVFSKVGTILHISIPKYPDSKVPKGFAFIQFSNKQEAEQAIMRYNNCIPQEFLEGQSKGKHVGLKVLTKRKWLSYKDEFKEIKKELLKTLGDSQSHVHHAPDSRPPRQNEEDFIEPQVEIKIGTVAKLKSVPATANKAEIKLAVSHFVIPTHVDYKPGSEEAFVRFENTTLCQAFFDKFTSFSEFRIMDKLVEVARLTEVEENQYWEEIIKGKRKFREFLFKKKKLKQK